MHSSCSSRSEVPDRIEKVLLRFLFRHWRRFLLPCTAMNDQTNHGGNKRAPTGSRHHHVNRIHGEHSFRRLRRRLVSCRWNWSGLFSCRLLNSGCGGGFGGRCCSRFFSGSGMSGGRRGGGCGGRRGGSRGGGTGCCRGGGCGRRSGRGSGSSGGGSRCSGGWNIGHSHLHVDHILFLHVVGLNRPLAVVINVQ